MTQPLTEIIFIHRRQETHRGTANNKIMSGPIF